MTAPCTCLSRATAGRINEALYRTQTSGKHTEPQIRRVKSWVGIYSERMSTCPAHGWKKAGA